MPIERHRSPVTITTVPRNTLVQTCHKEIDGILKDLKLCSRRLKSALDGFKDELQILERLYYKCKNQHCMALFFKRVPEMRRYGRRLSEMDILERVDLLRAAFVGLAHTNDHKALRSSWTHTPEEPYVNFLKERLSACSALVCKMQERLKEAYYHFTLAMQTGAFVQIIILFVAISSRMLLLSSQLEEVLQFSILTCNRLLAIIHPTDIHATVFQQLSSGAEASYPSQNDRDVPPEDMGQLVSRRHLINTSTLLVEDSSLGTGAVSESLVTCPPCQSTNADSYTTAQASKKVTAKMVQKSLRKKGKKKLDEIDEIFGF